MDRAFNSCGGLIAPLRGYWLARLLIERRAEVLVLLDRDLASGKAPLEDLLWVLGRGLLALLRALTAQQPTRP